MIGILTGITIGIKEPKWFKNSDIIKVKIKELGSIKNKIVFK